MTFQISVQEEKEHEVLQIMQALQAMGHIRIKQTESLALEGDPLNEDELLEILEERSNSEHFLTHEEATKFFRFWQQMKQK